MKLILTKDKVTPGTVRFKEDSKDHPITSLLIYLARERVTELGNPESVSVDINKVS